MIKHYLKINFSASSFLILSCLLVVQVFLPNSVVLADSFRQGKVFIGADLGAAQISRQSGDSQRDDGWLYGSLWTEYGLTDQVFLGVEGMGWTDQETSNDPIAEDVMAFMVTAKVYPLLMPGFYVKAGWGYAKHRYWDGTSGNDTSGNADLVGLGFLLDTSFLQVSYSRGDLGQGNYKALTLSVSFPFYMF